MGLNYMSLLTPSKAPFYGIVPGNSSTPIGSVTLPVTFGTKQNFRTEYIKFEVAKFESSYHAILGRPALANCFCPPGTHSDDPKSIPCSPIPSPDQPEEITGLSQPEVKFVIGTTFFQ